MSKISGSYVVSHASNAAESYRLNNALGLTEEEIAVALSPENKVTITYNEFEDGSGTVVVMKSTLMKKLDGEYKYKYGEDIEMKFSGKPLVINVTKKGNQLVERMKVDGVEHTYKLNFSSLGMMMEHSATGHGLISTAFWERQEAPIAGYYVLERHENAEKAMAAANMSAAALQKLMANMSTRMAKIGDDLWEMTEYFGDGTKRSLQFKFGEEFQFDDKVIGVNGSHLVTLVAPGQISYVMKDNKTGSIETWEGSFCADGMLWTTEKSGSTVKFYYRRYSDFEGTWKKANSHNQKAFMTALGMPDDLIEKYMNDTAKMTLNNLGAGVWNCSTDSKVLPQDDFTFRHGEEFSLDYSGMVITCVINFTRDGFVESKKINGKTIKTVAKIGPNFMNVEDELIDEPGMKMLYTLVRC